MLYEGPNNLASPRAPKISKPALGILLELLGISVISLLHHAAAKVRWARTRAESSRRCYLELLA
jgi:hypothetical protein